MADTAPQSAASHARWRPSYHFITGPILFANVINAAVQLRHGIRWDTVFPALLAVALVLLYFHARLMALSVQDRVIRLEERLRLRELLPAALQPRIAEFTVPQLVGLRFASDAELPALAERVLSEGITEKKQIVALIRTWRPDHQRA